jgi:hypothetical protein
MAYIHLLAVMLVNNSYVLQRIATMESGSFLALSAGRVGLFYYRQLCTEIRLTIFRAQVLSAISVPYFWERVAQLYFLKYHYAEKIC